jgi:glycosyltransferase involved in cell wall biosynthesis
MRIGFIEDTHLRGGTQLWVLDAIDYYVSHGDDVYLIAPRKSWIALAGKRLGARVSTYDYEGIVERPEDYQKTWVKALRNMDVVVATVHPPRKNFHCVKYAAACIKFAEISTYLIAKTGTVVPQYKREFYVPDPTINHAVIAISAFTKKYLINHYKISARKVSLIYQGVDLAAYNPHRYDADACRKLLHVGPTDEPVIGCIGSFEGRKGQKLLIEAFAPFLKRYPHSRLVLVGEGPDEASYRPFAKKHGVDQALTIVPFTAESAGLYRSLNMLVLPSIEKEGLPNVILEAMAMNVPVIATRLAGIPEVIRHRKTGMLITPKKVSLITRSLFDLWQNERLYLSVKERAADFIDARMDKDKQFRRFREHFRTLIKS